MSKEYTYRGIYDEGERGRIQSLLDQQQELFREEENKQQPTSLKIQKYFLIAMGVSVIILITKVLSKWKK